MSDLPKEEKIDFDAEISGFIDRLEAKYPGLTQDINFKAFRRYTISKLNAEWFDRIASSNACGGGVGAGVPVLKVLP